MRRARALRQAMTDAEKALWRRLRHDQLGVRFRRQHPIGPYIADFACRPVRLIVEVDGGQHAVRPARDQRRDAWLKGQGFTVLRFWNHDVLGNLDAVVNSIHAEVLRLSAAEDAVMGDRPDP
ncbi:DUF559 domain-containing protein [Roseospira navarrensis]|uniref:DUF559 domain-containing protein n=1 Tax=Roseospira navarrensis TaxID=140058 RepID=A0A7X1ZGR9_9PROT|nr:DUF559 domain-containing protein [Roseospira navarrensis]